MKILKIYLTLGLFGLLNTGMAHANQLREPNNNEQFYHYVAYQLNEPDLCEKISSQASFYGDPQKTNGIEFYRAECYYDIATQYRRIDVCRKVTPVYKGFKLFAGGYSELSPSWCKKKIREQGPGNIAFALNDDQIIPAFSAMGYRPETLYLEGVTPQIEKIDLTNAYVHLGKKKDIVERIEQSRTSTDIQSEFLYDLAAHVTNDIKWCMKIRDTVPSPPSRYPAAYKDHFLDTCVFEIASNTRQKSLCASIPDRPEYENNIFSIKQECYRQIDGLNKYPSNTRYSYLIPADDHSITEIIKLLGYPLPDIKDVSSSEIAQSYSSFIFELADQSKLEKTSARQKFLEKLRKLPSYE